MLLCNELGVNSSPPPDTHKQPPDHLQMVDNCGRASISIKEAVRIAQNNNLMGLICTSRLLDLVPALVNSIKEAGLVLISDYSSDYASDSSQSRTRTRPSVLGLPKGVDGLLMDNAVLRFKEVVDQ